MTSSKFRTTFITIVIVLAALKACDRIHEEGVGLTDVGGPCRAAINDGPAYDSIASFGADLGPGLGKVVIYPMRGTSMKCINAAKSEVSRSGRRGKVRNDLD